eukprot:scaffold67896_cov40-Cyclotella_meneghiniana.AAC.1
MSPPVAQSAIDIDTSVQLGLWCLNHTYIILFDPLARVPFAVRDAPGWVWGFLIDLAKAGKEDAEVRVVTFNAGASTGTELKQKP